VQGTQGNLKLEQQSPNEGSQMSVFNKFQQELSKIGRPNHIQVSLEDVMVDIDDEGHESSASEEDEQEQSVVYSTGGNIFD